MVFIKKEDKRSDLMDMLSTAGTLGLQIVSCTVVGLAMGWAIDHYAMKWYGWDTAPWGLLVMLCFGIVAGFRDVVLHAKKVMRAEEEREKQAFSHTTEQEPDKGQDDA